MDSTQLAEELKKAIERFEQISDELKQLLNKPDGGNGASTAKVREMAQAEIEVTHLSKALRESRRQTREGHN